MEKHRLRQLKLQPFGAFGQRKKVEADVSHAKEHPITYGKRGHGA